MNDLILASGSPRRKDMLTAAGYSFRVIVPDVDESNHDNLPPEELVTDLARRKGLAISPEYPRAIVLSADTVVVREGEILGKPGSEAEAVRMLSSLSGRTHEVLTGYCLARDTRIVKLAAVTTQVTFRILTKAQVVAYAAAGSPLDKAGAYGIQDLGGSLVKEIRGSYTNVVGLPLAEVVEELGRLGVQPGQ